MDNGFNSACPTGNHMTEPIPGKDEPLRCEHCGGRVTDDGYTKGEDHCCYYCKVD